MDRKNKTKPKREIHLSSTNTSSFKSLYILATIYTPKKKVSEYLLHLNEDVWNYAILSMSIYTYPS